MTSIQPQQIRGGGGPRGCPPEVRALSPGGGSPPQAGVGRGTESPSEKQGVRATPAQGCDVYPLCLECPLPRCVYEEPGGEKRALREKRNGEIRRLFQKGIGVEELSFAFNLSFRSIYRITGDGRGEKVSLRKQGVRQ